MGDRQVYSVTALSALSALSTLIHGQRSDRC